MTEMNWTRPPSDYVVVDRDTGERFGIEQTNWGTADVFGQRAIRFADRQLWTFGADGHGLHGMNVRLALRSEVEKPDPTLVERRLAWARMAHRRMNEMLGNEAAIYSLAASLAEWRG